MPSAETKSGVAPSDSGKFGSAPASSSSRAARLLERPLASTIASTLMGTSPGVSGTGSDTASVAGILKAAAAKSPPELVTLIVYDLPNRDCKAKASNGEICCNPNADGTCNYNAGGDCADGLSDYQTNYIDPFAALVAR